MAVTLASYPGGETSEPATQAENVDGMIADGTAHWLGGA